MSLRVRDLVSTLDAEFPFAWAEPWDNVGLLVGDPDSEVAGVCVTLDATPQAIDRAVEAGANVLLTHHPAFLGDLGSVVPGSGSQAIAYAAASAGVALVACHTNLDRAPGGAASLGAALGLPPGVPVERSLQSMAMVTVFVPAEARGAVAASMAAAGAGRVGLYADCSFSAEGTGRTMPLPGSDPYLGEAGTLAQIAEERLEMVCAPADAGRVAHAARESHPYDEPLIVVADVMIARGVARMGRLAELDGPRTLDELARDVASKTGSTPRVWGEPDATVRRVATATGSAGGLIADVRASGADTLIAGEVRYHDALAASGSGLAIIEIGHDVSEWPLVPVLAGAVREGCEGLTFLVEPPRVAWWTP